MTLAIIHYDIYSNCLVGFNGNYVAIAISEQRMTMDSHPHCLHVIDNYIYFCHEINGET